jgi:hypothetical protein
METTFMLDEHQSTAPWAWPMAAQEATTLAAEPVPRWLHVNEGCVWVTARQAGPHGADLWLGAGDSLALPAGSAWVVQAWPQARLSVLLQAPAAFSRGAQPLWGAWWRGAWWRRVWPRALAA